MLAAIVTADVTAVEARDVDVVLLPDVFGLDVTTPNEEGVGVDVGVDDRIGVGAEVGVGVRLIPEDENQKDVYGEVRKKLISALLTFGTPEEFG